ncbi:LuxR C-terminal-related transcriptional regulator [Sinomonas sp. ASV486]|uniref:helix-turn-helix transcriptional regulator n=1 Tax=Sinomonas sp. ASV486 TaxID=3051170 RepID=UPI0027DE09E4|nr:LuxR C-terminal-related transcriptional regulator [Sinomonas sp. ASV486]MDQ4490342.1 LuxR C-terminal-related transcriptional regulator [Sinomonas sp. ASV486]
MTGQAELRRETAAAGGPTRQGIASAAADLLRREGPTAVFIVGELGSGRSHLLDAILAELAGEVTPFRLSTGHSLRDIPYAALLARLPQLTVDDVQDRVGVLRALWSELRRTTGETGQPVLVVVDDAQDLDDGSAGLIAEAVASSWVRLLAAGTARSGLPGDLLEMWHDGIAERIELPPLSLAEAKGLVEGRLGGRLSATAARVLHSIAGGNPLHLVSLLDEALEGKTLVRQDGLWLLTAPFRSRGEALAEYVRSGMEALAPAEREAVMLVALTEPLPRAAARALIMRDVLDRLLELGWLTETAGDGLRVRSRLEGDAVRRMTTATRRLHLYRRAEAAGDDLRQPANELRLLELALGTGTVLPAAELLARASTAVRRFDSELGLRAAAMIDGDAERSLVRGVVARAHLNLGSPEAALAAVARGPADPSDAADVLAGSLVKFMVRLALGDLERVEEDAVALEKAAANVSHGDARVIGPGAKEAVLRRARLLRALASAERADFGAVAAALEEDGRSARASAAPEIEKYLWILLDSEVQLAAGRYERAAHSAGVVLAGRVMDEEHFPLAEHGLVRYLAGAVLAGDWEDIDGVLGSSERGHLRPVVVYGPCLDCARSYVLLRQGRAEEADAVLADVVQNLELLDPLRLRGLAWSFAAWSAAAIAHPDVARARLARAEQTAGVGSAAMRHLAAMHRAGALEMLDAGAGLPLLAAMAEEDHAASRPGWELVARIIGFELGASDDDGRGAGLAAEAEGSWASAWAAWASAQTAEGPAGAANPGSGGAAEGYLAAGELFRSLGMLRRARAAFARAAACSDSAGDRAAARRAAAAAGTCEGLPGSGEAGEREEAVLASLRLSRREQDVVDLALDGLSDRQIADRLHLSVRTVEGHLHRSYAKLGIRSREELRAAVLG